jgi:MFS family permease
MADAALARTAPGGRGGGRGVVWVLAYCGALVSISQTVSLPLLPVLPEELNTSVANVSWVATAVVLSGAIANPVFGRLGDMYGKRRTMIVALVIALAGSILCAIAPSLVVLVVGRTMQGLGIAVLPLGMGLAKESLPPERVNGGIALVSATMGIGGGIGLPLAGVAAGWFDWHAVFWISAGLTVIAIVAAITVLPDDRSGAIDPFDVAGATWLSVCLVALLLPLSKAATWGWLRPLPIALYALGTIGLAAWWWYESRPARPLVNVTLMRQRPLLIVNGVGLLLGFAMFCNMYAPLVLLQMPDTVEHGFGLSIVKAGLLMAPGSIAMMATSPLSARLTDRTSARTTLAVGAATIGIGYAARPMMLGSLVAIAISVAFVNAGVGLAYAAMPTTIMQHVPPSELGSANAIGTLTRAVGASISGAAVGALLSSITIVVDGVERPAIGAFTWVFALAAVCSFAGAAGATRLPRVTSPTTLTLDPAVTVPAI